MKPLKKIKKKKCAHFVLCKQGSLGVRERETMKMKLEENQKRFALIFLLTFCLQYLTVFDI